MKSMVMVDRFTTRVQVHLEIKVELPVSIAK